MRRLPQPIRSVIALLLGLAAVSIVVEVVELGIVAAVAGGMPSGQDEYFTIRNRPLILAAKFAYNAAGGFVGGIVAANLAGRSPVTHGSVLGVIQAVLLIWAMMHPELGRTAPGWAWIGFVVTTTIGIVGGALWASRRYATK